MNRKAQVKQLFSAGFKESAEWTDWFFEQVYSDDDARVIYDDNRPAACLLMSPYRLKLGGSDVKMGYISCCTTAPQMRRRGYMSRLLDETLRQAAADSYAVASLIPASERLYFFYDHFGFSTVFYDDEHRYTSLHRFESSDRFVTVPAVYDDFHALELKRDAAVIHSHDDFSNILTDNALDGGHVISIHDRESGEPAAMIFATVGDSAAVVRDILSVSDEANETVLGLLKEAIGQLMIIVRTPPSQSPLMLKSRGMARIVNVRLLLEALAAEHPDVDQTIRVHDSLLPDNNGIFIVRKGRVEHTDSTSRRVTLDVSVETLAKIIFNSHRIGDTFGLPTFRPTMALMLD